MAAEDSGADGCGSELTPMVPENGRVYRMMPGWVMIHDLMGLVPLVFAVLLMRLGPWAWLGAVLVWLPGLAIHYYSRRVQLVWLPDRLRYRNLFRTRDLPFADIVSWNYGADLEFETRQGALFRVSKTLAFDAEFLEWLRTYPNCTTDRRAESEKQVREALPLWAVSFTLAGWSWLYPSPSRLMVFVLLLAPWMMMAWTGVLGRRGRWLGELGDLAWLLPAFALGRLATDDPRMAFAWNSVNVAVSVGLGLGLLAVVHWADPAAVAKRSRLAMLLLFWIPVVVYGQVAAVQMLWRGMGR